MFLGSASLLSSIDSSNAIAIMSGTCQNIYGSFPFPCTNHGCRQFWMQPFLDTNSCQCCHFWNVERPFQRQKWRSPAAKDHLESHCQLMGRILRAIASSENADAVVQQLRRGQTYEDIANASTTTSSFCFSHSSIERSNNRSWAYFPFILYTLRTRIPSKLAYLPNLSTFGSCTLSKLAYPSNLNTF